MNESSMFKASEAVITYLPIKSILIIYGNQAKVIFMFKYLNK